MSKKDEQKRRQNALDTASFDIMVVLCAVNGNDNDNDDRLDKCYEYERTIEEGNEEKPDKLTKLVSSKIVEKIESLSRDYGNTYEGTSRAINDLYDALQKFASEDSLYAIKKADMRRVAQLTILLHHLYAVRTQENEEQVKAELKKAEDYTNNQTANISSSSDVKFGSFESKSSSEREDLGSKPDLTLKEIKKALFERFAVSDPKKVARKMNIELCKSTIRTFLTLAPVLGTFGLTAFIVAALHGSISQEFEVFGYQPVPTLSSWGSTAVQSFESALSSIGISISSLLTTITGVIMAQLSFLYGILAAIGEALAMIPSVLKEFGANAYLAIVAAVVMTMVAFFMASPATTKKVFEVVGFIPELLIRMVMLVFSTLSLAISKKALYALLTIISVLGTFGLTAFIVAALHGSISQEFEVFGYQPVPTLSSWGSTAVQSFESALSSIGISISSLLTTITGVIMAQLSFLYGILAAIGEALAMIPSVLKEFGANAYLAIVAAVVMTMVAFFMASPATTKKVFEVVGFIPELLIRMVMLVFSTLSLAISKKALYALLTIISVLGTFGLTAFIVAALHGSISQEFEVFGYQPVPTLSSWGSTAVQSFESALSSIGISISSLLTTITGVIMAQLSFLYGILAAIGEALAMIPSVLKEFGANAYLAIVAAVVMTMVAFFMASPATTKKVFEVVGFIPELLIRMVMLVFSTLSLAISKKALYALLTIISVLLIQVTPALIITSVIAFAVVAPETLQLMLSPKTMIEGFACLAVASLACYTLSTIAKKLPTKFDSTFGALAIYTLGFGAALYAEVCALDKKGLLECPFDQQQISSMNSISAVSAALAPAPEQANAVVTIIYSSLCYLEAAILRPLAEYLVGILGQPVGFEARV